jgi:hypothetical protein
MFSTFSARCPSSGISKSAARVTLLVRRVLPVARSSGLLDFLSPLLASEVFLGGDASSLSVVRLTRLLRFSGEAELRSFSIFSDKFFIFPVDLGCDLLRMVSPRGLVVRGTLVLLWPRVLG